MIRITCVAVLVLLALLHSVLGELRILAPLDAATIPRDTFPLGRQFSVRTLRFVWHLLSAAWVALAWLVARADAQTLLVTGVFLLASGGLALGVSRGQHFAWALFIVGGATALLGPRLDAVAPWAAGVAAALLGVIALVHVGWMLGMRRGLRAAIPEVTGRPAFVPGRVATLAVTSGFVAAAALVVVASRGAPKTASLLALAGAVVFAARAFGDFRWVGLTKRARGTSFARWDDALYTPLCVLLAVCFALVGARGLA